MATYCATEERKVPYLSDAPANAQVTRAMKTSFALLFPSFGFLSSLPHVLDYNSFGNRIRLPDDSRTGASKAK